MYLESNRDECTVSLVYVVHLEKQGSVSFTYQYPDNNILFEFYVSGCVLQYNNIDVHVVQMRKCLFLGSSSGPE